MPTPAWAPPPSASAPKRESPTKSRSTGRTARPNGLILNLRICQRYLRHARLRCPAPARALTAQQHPRRYRGGRTEDSGQHRRPFALVFVDRAGRRTMPDLRLQPRLRSSCWPSIPAVRWPPLPGTATAPGPRFPVRQADPASYCTGTFTAVAGTTYLISVDGNADSAGTNEQFVNNTGTPVGAGQFTLRDRGLGLAGHRDRRRPHLFARGRPRRPGRRSEAEFHFLRLQPGRFAQMDGPGRRLLHLPRPPRSAPTARSSTPARATAISMPSPPPRRRRLEVSGGRRVPVDCSPMAVAVDGTIYVRDGGTALYAITPAGVQEVDLCSCRDLLRRPL